MMLRYILLAVAAQIFLGTVEARAQSVVKEYAGSASCEESKVHVLLTIGPEKRSQVEFSDGPGEMPWASLFPGPLKLRNDFATGRDAWNLNTEEFGSSGRPAFRPLEIAFASAPGKPALVLKSDLHDGFDAERFGDCKSFKLHRIAAQWTSGGSSSAEDIPRSFTGNLVCGGKRGGPDSKFELSLAIGPGGMRAEARGDHDLLRVAAQDVDGA